MTISINLCSCGNIFRTYFCKKCDDFQQELCKQCHDRHFSEIQRMKDLSKLKRDFHV